MVQQKGTQTLYAMKTLQKEKLLKDEKVLKSTLLEKEILKGANHPCIVGTDFVFQTDSMIYFIMKYVRGGDLYTHLRNVTRFDEE